MEEKPPLREGKPPVHVEEVEVDPHLDPSVQDKIVDAEARNAKNGRIAGIIVIVLGVLLTLLGATGAVDMNLGGFGINAKVTNAAPGVVAMLIGLFIVKLTNLRIKAARGGK